MRNTLTRVAVLCTLAATIATAQQPDTTRRPPARTRADSLRADSVRQAIQDSLALMRELEKTRPTRETPAQGAAGGAQGPINPRLIPDISAVGDFVGDLSPKGSTQEPATRLGVREVEVAVQAVVDPYFRGDVFLGFSDAEGVAIEQAYLTTTSLTDLEIRLGRYLMPFGKQNTTHRHDLHTVEYPWVLQRFLSADGFKGTGVYASRVFAPFGFYQELIGTAVDRFGDAPQGLTTADPVNKKLSGLTFSGRLRNYVDLTQATNVELSFSAATGRVERQIGLRATDGEPAPFSRPTTFNAVGARQHLVGADFTYRWRPLQQGLYRSFILQAEVMHQMNERSPTLPPCAPFTSGPDVCTAPAYLGPTRDFTGAYTFARYQIGQRLYLGGRYDWLQDPLANGGTFTAGSGYLEWFPSEFSKLVASVERTMPAGAVAVNRLLLQATFALGPHKPHPF